MTDNLSTKENLEKRARISVGDRVVNARNNDCEYVRPRDTGTVSRIDRDGDLWVDWDNPLKRIGDNTTWCIEPKYCDLVAARQQAQPDHQGYVDAFYEICDMLRIERPQPASPKEVWEGQVKPALRALQQAQPDPVDTVDTSAGRVDETADRVHGLDAAIAEDDAAWALIKIAESAGAKRDDDGDDPAYSSGSWWELRIEHFKALHRHLRGQVPDDSPRMVDYRVKLKRADEAITEALSIGGPARERAADLASRDFVGHFLDWLHGIVAPVKPVDPHYWLVYGWCPECKGTGARNGPNGGRCPECGGGGLAAPVQEKGR